MQYQQRIVAFIDFLGFKELIDKTVTSEEQLSHLVNALEFCREHFKPLEIEGLPPIKDRVVTHFSDSIVISFSISEESGVFYALLDIQHLLMVLAENGYLCRGGIACGQMIHTNDIALGPAFIEAYELESKHALFPRVIVADEIIELGATFHGDQHDYEDELNYIKAILSRDLDGRYYIDYFEKTEKEMDDPQIDIPRYFQALEIIIRSGLGSKNAQVHAKYVWMATKHNKMAKAFKLQQLFTL